MPEMIYKSTTHDITVSVRVNFLPRSEDALRLNKWVWTYHITLQNEGPLTVQLKTRHWRITDARGRVQIVEGEGVVGETPVIKPGERYS